MRFIITCLFVISCAALSAAESAPLQKKISLGISIDKEATPFEGAQGVAIYSVHLNSNADRLGLKKNDRIIKVNDTEITNFQTLAHCLAPLQDGAQVTVNFIRNDKKQSCSGTLRAQLTAADTKNREESLHRRLDAVKDHALKKERYDLKDLLIILRQIEHDLPEAAKEFKKTYPNGRFRISMNIDIDSDTSITAEDKEKKEKKEEQTHAQNKNPVETISGTNKDE